MKRRALQVALAVLAWSAAATAGRGPMHLIRLANSSAVCNDGTTPGYYYRPASNGSQRWMVFLEGGGFCWDTASCASRWRRRRRLMSSSTWPRSRSPRGLLSADARSNPHYHDAHHVLVPYCSSDAWVGTRTQGAPFAFAGKLIVSAVLADLPRLGLSGGRLILAGSSAGGAGVLLNADAARRALRTHGVRVAAVADSGWFLDRPSKHGLADSTTEMARRGHALWHGSPPSACARDHAAEPWLCYFGYRLYRYLRTPLFVFQWLFDSVQLAAEGVRAPSTRRQWDVVHSSGGALRASLRSVRAVFAPACLAHGVLATREWGRVRVANASLPTALRCWEARLGGRGGRDRSRRPADLAHVACPLRRLVERCSWPQCNGSCPRLRDPRTGEEVALVALLRSFGLDVVGAARALGVEERALAAMGRAELLALLTQHA